MNNLVCLQHPHYDGVAAPELSCKTCCSIFISKIKENNRKARGQNTREWLDEKVKSKDRRSAEAQNDSFHPEMI